MLYSNKMKFKVEPKIFEKFPGVRIGVLVILGMDNSKNKEEVAELLRREEKRQNQILQTVDFGTLPETARWRKIYEQFGSKPRDFRSSVEALLKRVRTGNPVPSINPLVDLYNYLSIRYYLPAGAEDLDKVVGDIKLTFAKGVERGRCIGSEEIDTCYPGEIIYKDNKGFICRRWNWREANRTKIDEATQNAALVLEALPVVSEEKFKEALKEARELVGELLGGEVVSIALTQNVPVMEVDFKTGKKARVLADETKSAGRKRLKVLKREGMLMELRKPTAALNLTDKESLVFKLRQIIFSLVEKVVGKGTITIGEISVEHPAEGVHGDYATSIALILAKKLKKNPLEMAKQTVAKWQEIGLPDCVKKIEVAPPGFLNLWLQNDYFVNQLQRVLKEKERFGSSGVLEGKKILLEHTSPNPQTTIMIGHLRNNFLGMSVANVLTFLGAKVTKDCIVNDRGVHICRAIWGYLVFAKKSVLDRQQILNFKEIPDGKIQEIASRVNWRQLLEEWVSNPTNWVVPADLGLKPDHSNLIWYVLGSRASELLEIKTQVEEILIAWEVEDKKVWQIWRQLLGWVKEGYGETYKRIGSIHDYVWYESNLYKGGKKLVYQGLEKGVFKKSEGAIVTDLVKYGLPDTVVIKSDGTALYHTFDIYLTSQKRKKFPSDLYIWDIGAEQTLYFKQLFVICEQLGIGKREDYFHLGYALINFKGGKKMSTRWGDIVKADEILDLLKSRAKEIITTSNQELRGKLSSTEFENLAEKVAVGAVKYSLLKYSRETTIYFDMEESLSLEGNSAPYLQYTYTRTQSVLKKAGKPVLQDKNFNFQFNQEETAILKTVYQFPEIVNEAARQYAPNLICNFLFDLAQKFNLFYDKWRIIGEEQEDFRLLLTAAVGQVIKNGLKLLGIETLKRM